MNIFSTKDDSDSIPKTPLEFTLQIEEKKDRSNANK